VEWEEAATPDLSNPTALIAAPSSREVISCMQLGAWVRRMFCLNAPSCALM
jgi:hypothetical protein